MNQKKSRMKPSGFTGSVTVTFSLVFLLMFSFVLSVFEFAAYTARQTYHAAAASLAVENFFAGFLTPLYEDYHIFAKEAKGKMELTEFADSCILPDVLFMTKKLEGERSLLLRGGAEYQTEAAYVLSSGRAEGFTKQAEETVLYRSPILAKDTFQKLFSMTDTVNTHMEAATQGAKTAEAYALVDQSILQLIRLVDGVTLNQYERFLRGRSTIFLEESFVKLLCNDPRGAASSFERTEVYQSFLERVINPSELLTELLDGITALLPHMEERQERERTVENRLNLVEKLKEEKTLRVTQLTSLIDETTVALSGCQSRIFEIKQKNPRSQALLELYAEEEKLSKRLEDFCEEAKHIEEAKPSLLSEAERLKKEQKELLELKREQEKKADAFLSEDKYLYERYVIVSEKCREAILLTNQIREDIQAAKKQKELCEKTLDVAAVLLSEEAVSGYREELSRYSFYESSAGFDFEMILETLTNNRELLQKKQRCLSGTSLSDLQRAVDLLKTDLQQIGGLSLNGLRLSYGDLSLSESLQDQAKSVVKNAAGNSFLSLLTSEKLSEKEIELSFLPSMFLYQDEKETNPLKLPLSGTVSAFSSVNELLPVRGEGDGLFDAVLFETYLLTHFKDYSSPGNGALSYELEYIVCGGKTDKANMTSILTKICMVRTVLHFISLFSNKEKKAPAEQAAAAACGAIGLPALKSVLLFFFLLIFALEEAVIDTAALLQQKELPVYPGKNGGSLVFSELFLFSGKMVKEKAKAKKSEIGSGFSYKDYCKLFLLLTSKEEKTFRALDLIQENLRLSYNKEFRVNKMIWRLDYNTDGRPYTASYLPKKLSQP